MNREYKLAADPIKPGGPLTYRREILQITDDGHREVIAVVSNKDAIDVLEVIRRAYQDGREDNAAILDAEGRLLTAPRGREEAQP